MENHQCAVGTEAKAANHGTCCGSPKTMNGRRFRSAHRIEHGGGVQHLNILEPFSDGLFACGPCGDGLTLRNCAATSNLSNTMLEISAIAKARSIILFIVTPVFL